MGVKPPLPAPTESSTLQTSGGSVTGTDLATDVSRRTDKTSVSIPEDGSPVTISTKKRRDNRDKSRENTLTRASHHSQTSLLIEYFEGGKGPNVHARPSVRVKVTPSAARKIKDTNEHIQITEAGGDRKPSYTRRISLGPKSSGERQITESADDRSISSYTSAAEESNLARRQPPLEIEVMRRGTGSDLSTTSVPKEKRYADQNASEISSMPPDSMLEGNGGNITPKRTRSRSVSREAVVTANNTLKTPSRRRSRSLSKERLTQKVIEKLGSRPREISSGKHKTSSKTRSRSVSNEQIRDVAKSSRRRSGKYHEEVSQSGAESIVTDVSPKRRSGDQYSIRSGTSKSSINNPKLLEAVEDTIRRLILPELSSLKQEQRAQQNRNRLDREHRDSITSGSSLTRDETTRRVSKHASAPNVKPKVVLNRDGNNEGIILSGNSIKGRKESRRDQGLNSPSETSFQREMSEETVVQDNGKVVHKKSKDGHRLRDAAAGGLVGGILTAAALRHHDSKSSIESRDRRRRRKSRSHSRSASIAESTEEIFHKHDVPPMPMRSDVHSSELTRESILSDRTEEPSSPTSELRRKEIREVSRGSPREVLSPASRTPTRTPLSGKGLGTHHSNLSRGDLSIHSRGSDQSLRSGEHHDKTGGLGAVAAVGAGALAATSIHRDAYDDHEDGAYSRRNQSRGLSPIQSVASYREESEINHGINVRETHSSESLSSLGRKNNQTSGLSIKSLSSVASTNIARSIRPKGINLENGQDVLDQHEALRDSTISQSGSPSRDHVMDEWYEQQHEENERYRESMARSSDPRIDIKHLTNYTDDSMDPSYLDPVAESQHVHDIGANPEYIHTPVAVESAVASLHDPSVLSVRSKFGNKSMTDSEEGHRDYTYHQESDKGFENAERGDERQHEHTGKLEVSQRSPAESPRQSIAKSAEDREDEEVVMGASGFPLAHDPMPEIGHIPGDSESDLNTNPSIIQGPIGGVNHGSRDHWPYQETPPQSKNEFLNRSNHTSAQESLKAAARSFLVKAAPNIREEISQNEKRDISNDENQPPVAKDGYGESHFRYPESEDERYVPTLPKDEGYVSAQQPRSPGLSPQSKARSPSIFEDPGINIGRDLGADDPFIGNDKHTRHLSGYSQGMPSPLYDSATGGGIDRIQSKDIVALMDHLTVRDAQRNARDTEILVTLVRSAAEMRNSFEDMKKFIAEQDDMIIDTGNKQHDRTIQKVIGGPRPQPLGTPRAPRRPSEEEYTDDLPAKRRNVFKRALKGLGGRNGNDLARIEEMLVHLLNEVEDLKNSPGVRSSTAALRPDSQDSYNHSREVTGDGYEPEGQAGTSSNGNHSGYFSNPPSRQGNTIRSQEVRRGSQNRVSTVLEGDEDLDTHEQNVLDIQFEKNETLLTPTRETARTGSVPLATPPQTQVQTGAQSNENTPRTATDRSRKHKSSSSSGFFPKISRWSKTTASSMGDNFRNSRQQQQTRPLSEISRSGSDLQYNSNDHYDPHGEDRLRSNDSLANDPMHQEESRPRSPLVPSNVSEDPKYQAHRNSINLQHPQPRPGPTHRYQTQLESQAHNFGSPISPTSDQWGSNPSLARFAPVGAGNRHSGGAGYLSPISDGGSELSATNQSSTAPPRPPKVRDEDPLIPARPPKIQQLSQERLGNEQHYSNGSLERYGNANTSPRSIVGTATAAPQRKPTGPRPITGSGSWSPDRAKRQRYHGSSNRVDSSAEDVTF